MRTYATLRSSGAVGSAARGASAPTEGEEGRGDIVAAPAPLVELDIMLGPCMVYDEVIQCNYEF